VQNAAPQAIQLVQAMAGFTGGIGQSKTRPRSMTSTQLDSRF
jgi:hypothetical protein